MLDVRLADFRISEEVVSNRHLEREEESLAFLYTDKKLSEKLRKYSHLHTYQK